MKPNFIPTDWRPWTVAVLVVGFLLYMAQRFMTKSIAAVGNEVDEVKDAAQNAVGDLWDSLFGQSDEEKETDAVNNQMEQEFGQIAGKSYSDTWYQAKAQECYNAMNGVFTDTSTIRATFEALKTDGDTKALYNAYGVRSVSFTYFYSYEGTLAQHVRDELSGSILEYVDGKLKSAGL